MRGIRTARAGRNAPLHGLEDKPEETVIVGKERLTIRKRVAVTGQHPFDHRLLGKMQKNPFSKRFCARLRGGKILERGLDCVRHRPDNIGGEQRVGVRKGKADPPHAVAVEGVPSAPILSRTVQP